MQVSVDAVLPSSVMCLWWMMPIVSMWNMAC